MEIKGIYSPLEKFSFSTHSKIIIEKQDKIESQNNIIQIIKECQPVNHSVTKDEIFKAMKKKPSRNFQHYLKLLDENTKEG